MVKKTHAHFLLESFKTAVFLWRAAGTEEARTTDVTTPLGSERSLRIHEASRSPSVTGCLATECMKNAAGMTSGHTALNTAVTSRLQSDAVTYPRTSPILRVSLNIHDAEPAERTRLQTFSRFLDLSQELNF